MKLFLQKLFAWLQSHPEPIPFDEMEAECPRCEIFRVHRIKSNYFLICTACGNQQYKDEALTREDTAW